MYGACLKRFYFIFAPVQGQLWFRGDLVIRRASCFITGTVACAEQGLAAGPCRAGKGACAPCGASTELRSRRLSYEPRLPAQVGQCGMWRQTMLGAKRIQQASSPSSNLQPHIPLSFHLSHPIASVELIYPPCRQRAKLTDPPPSAFPAQIQLALAVSWTSQVDGRRDRLG